VRIVGVSFNDPERNAKWVDNQSFPYEVWSDTQRQLALQLGAADSADKKVPRRVTALLDAQGRVVATYQDVRVGTHPQDVLEDCKRLFSAE